MQRNSNPFLELVMTEVSWKSSVSCVNQAKLHLAQIGAIIKDKIKERGVLGSLSAVNFYFNF